MVTFVILLLFITCGNGLENVFLGCFKIAPTPRSMNVSHIRRDRDCAVFCLARYYKYLSFYDGSCTCSNFLGEELSNSTCDSYCSFNCTGLSFTNVYETGNYVAGPPRGFHITNITTNSCRLTWKDPEAYVSIISYKVSAVVLHSSSNYLHSTMEWEVGNNSFHTQISGLLSASKYNVSVYASTNDGDGAKAYQIIDTKLADPENLPPQPVILSNDGNKIRIKLSPVSNNNGPVTAYRIIVVKSDEKQGFQKDVVLPYDEALKNGLSYYIAAEISPSEIRKEFVVGDGKKYSANKQQFYYNAPLDPNINYNVLIGLVSSYNGEVKVAYSEASGYNNGISVLNVLQDDDSLDDSSAVVTSLSVAIILLTIMLITGIIGFIILKKRVTISRQRLSDNQELTLQGPMIEVENNGYINDDEHIPAVSHYRNLKQKVRVIPHGQLKVEPANLLGVGKFGKVNTGTLHENGNMTTVTCYSIHDRKMNQDTKKGMLQELDVLIKTAKHDNIVNLIGTSETRDVVVVVMEFNSLNLKDFLLGSRDNMSGKFSTMTEVQGLEIAMGVCRGMVHLHFLNINHTQLCARSVFLTSNLIPKIGSFGLAQYFSHNKIPDYTRWSSLEVLKGLPSNSKSDVWSFACVLWEIVALGGTPYGNIPNNNEILSHLTKGVRLPQLQYVGDDLYQIMLDCWQLIADERPEFSTLLDSLEALKHSVEVAMSFKLFSSFQYEQFYPDVEFSARPVF